MITYLEIQTNKRFPAIGCESHFSEKTKENNKGENVIKLEYFIRGQGWKNAKKNQFKAEEIPDLNKDYTKQEWIEYSKLYGIFCAQEFINTCDYMKPREAWRMTNPTKNAETWDNPEIQLWFKTTFDRELNHFIDGYVWGLANSYQIDMIKFENHLAYEFNYPKDADGSMADFMTQKFGQETTEKFQNTFFPNK